MDIRKKIDVADIDGIDWNWLAKYGDEVADELGKAFTTSFVAEFPTNPQTVQQIAGEWAREQSANMVNNVVETSRARLREIVADGVSKGDSVGSMTKRIREDFQFSSKRAKLIARTESANALGQGQKGAAIAQGRDEKRWTTSGGVDDICLENESVGWIAMADPFPSGHDTIPAHPNCRCVVRYRSKAILNDGLEGKPEFRCVGCNRLLAKNAFKGTRIVCRHCKSERTSD